MHQTNKDIVVYFIPLYTKRAYGLLVVYIERDFVPSEEFKKGFCGIFDNSAFCH